MIFLQLRNQNNHLKSELDQMRAEFALVLADNHRLKEMIKTQTPQSVSIESDNFMQYNIHVTKRSTIEEKIGLYRSYFKGRDDVYAIRSNNKTGKSEYYPKREYLGKHDGKHVWGENLPLTDAVIRDHLQKEDPPVTVGIYPLLLDETCWFLALDFDNKTWQEDALAFLETCREYAVPASLGKKKL